MLLPIPFAAPPLELGAHKTIPPATQATKIILYLVTSTKAGLRHFHNLTIDGIQWSDALPTKMNKADYGCIYNFPSPPPPCVCYRRKEDHVIPAPTPTPVAYSIIHLSYHYQTDVMFEIKPANQTLDVS